MGTTKTTSKDLAGGLLYGMQKFSNSFYENFAPRAQEILGVKLDEAQLITLRREINTITLWVISKVLSPDKAALNELHKIYLLPHSNCNFLPHLDEKEICYGSFVPRVNQEEIGQWIKQKETGKLQEIFKRDKQELDERYKKYYEGWDDNSSMQNVLAITMCEYMFNNDQPAKRLVDIRLSFEVNTHILTTMKAILDLRKNYEVVD